MGTKRRLELNHSITRAHDFQGPFKYGQYGTETASTVVIGDTESVGTQVYRLLLLYTLSLLLYRLSRLVKVSIDHYVRIYTVQCLQQFNFIIFECTGIAVCIRSIWPLPLPPPTPANCEVTASADDTGQACAM